MRIALFNNYDSLYDNPEPRGLRNLISYADNTGNIVFLESIKRQVGAENVNILDFARNPKIYEEKYDYFILSLANMVSNKFHIDNEILDALSSISKPLCIFSVGIQVDNLESLMSLEISDSTKKVLDLAKKHGTTIGVRGFHTYEYLKKLDYNVDIIGCPSIFYQKVIPQKCLTPKNILVNGCFIGHWSAELEKLFHFGVRNNSHYLIQNESSLLVDKYNITDNELDNWGIQSDRLLYLKNRGYDYKYYTNEFSLLNSIKSTDLTSQELSFWLKNNSSFYTDFDHWLMSMSDYDLSLGFRLHGSVMSTLAGVPSLIINCDLRVDELVKYHDLPNIPLDTELNHMSPLDVMDLIDYDDYNKKYDSNKDNYLNYLNKNGLQFLLT